MSRTDLAVIGAGPGGYAAAFLAADLGMQVSLIDPAPNPGGVCLYRGCIPSKALLHVAKLLHETRAVGEWGVEFGAPKIDLQRMRARKEQVVETLTAGLGQLSRKRKITSIQGRAAFDGPHALSIVSPTGERDRLEFGHAIIATGSKPTALPGFPVSPRVWDSTAALELTEIPDTLLVVGGGYIGLELGSVYAALGTRVSVVEATDALLADVDADLVRPLERRLAREMEALLLDTRVVEVVEDGAGLRVRLEGADPGERMFDRMLVAVGRRPVTEGLELDSTAVAIDEAGFIEVDERLATAEPGVFAIGDVVGQPMLAHKASHEGRIAVEAIAGHKVAFAPAAIPAVVFTDPEIAWCGLSEREAKDAGREVRVARFPWAASGRAMTLGAGDGLTKLIVDPDSERILGVGIVGAGAGELIAEAVHAIEMGAVAADLKLTIHPHPTLSETLMEAAEVYFGQSTHVYRPRRD